MEKRFLKLQVYLLLLLELCITRPWPGEHHARVHAGSRRDLLLTAGKLTFYHLPPVELRSKGGPECSRTL